MKSVCVIIALLIGTNAFSSTDSLLIQTKNIIQQTLTYKEFNPYHKAVTDSIEEVFQHALSERNSTDFSSQYTSQIETLMRWIYENARSIYEDSPDYRRMKMRRALCFASLALLSDHDKAYTFLEYAKLSIVAELKKPDIGLLEEQYLGLLFMEVLFKIEAHALRKNDVRLLQEYLSVHHEYIDKKIYDRAHRLLQDYNILLP